MSNEEMKYTGIQFFLPWITANDLHEGEERGLSIFKRHSCLALKKKHTVAEGHCETARSGWWWAELMSQA